MSQNCSVDHVALEAWKLEARNDGQYEDSDLTMSDYCLVGIMEIKEKSTQLSHPDKMEDGATCQWIKFR